MATVLPGKSVLPGRPLPFGRALRGSRAQSSSPQTRSVSPAPFTDQANAQATEHTRVSDHAERGWVAGFVFALALLTAAFIVALPVFGSVWVTAAVIGFFVMLAGTTVVLLAKL